MRTGEQLRAPIAVDVTVGVNSGEADHDLTKDCVEAVISTESDKRKEPDLGTVSEQNDERKDP